MSYGSYASAARYREIDANSATPGQLVVLIYDHLLLNLMKAGRAMAPNQADARSDALQSCRALLTELLVTLDRSRGGDIATHLAAIYSFLLGELTTLGVRPDAARLERVTGMVRELREAFARITTQGAEAPDEARLVS